MSRNVEEEKRRTLEWKIIDEIALSVINRLRGIFQETETRMQGVYDQHGFPLVPGDKSAISSLLLCDDILITDCPKIFVPSPKLYTITSTMAFQHPGLRSSRSLYLDGIPTHRGICLTLLQAFLKALGHIGLENVDQLVWASPTIDPEQYRIDSEIAANRQLAEREIVAILFDYSGNGEDLAAYSRYAKLNPKLVKLIQMLKLNQDVESDSEIYQYIQELLQTLYKWTGIRQRWYKELVAVLTGQVKTESYLDRTTWDSVEFELLHALHKIIEYSKFRSLQPDPKVVVLEIDTNRLFDRPGLQALSLSRRPINTIVSLASVPMSAVTTAYVDDRVERTGLTESIQLRTIDDLPDKVWLTRSGQPVRPSDIIFNKMNPLEPLCDQRYAVKDSGGSDPMKFWVDQVFKGKTSMIRGRPPNLLGSDESGTYTDQLMRALIKRLIKQDVRYSEAVQRVGSEDRVMANAIVSINYIRYRFGISLKL